MFSHLWGMRLAAIVAAAASLSACRTSARRRRKETWKGTIIGLNK